MTRFANALVKWSNGRMVEASEASAQPRQPRRTSQTKCRATRADQVFAATCGLSKSDDLETALRIFLIQKASFLSSGEHASLSLEPKVRDQMRRRFKLRVSRDVAPHETTTHLPICDRWADIVALEYVGRASGGNTAVYRSDILAHRCRPTLPVSLRVPAHRSFGPAASVSAELEPSYDASVSLAGAGLSLRESKPTGGAGLRPAHHENLGGEASQASQASQAARSWPPDSLSSPVAAAAAEDAVLALRVAGNVGKVDAAHVDVLLRLGFGAGVDAHRSRRYAIHAAIVAHNRGYTALGSQLELLGALSLRESKPTGGAGLGGATPRPSVC